MERVAGSYEDVIRRFHARGMMIYGTFVFGYDATRRRASIAPPRSRARQSLCIANFQSAHPDAGHRPVPIACATRDASMRQNLVGSTLPFAMATPSLRRTACRRGVCAKARCARARPSIMPSIAERALRGAPKWRSPVKVGNHAARQCDFPA